MSNDFTAKRGRGRPPKNGVLKGAVPHTVVEVPARAEVEPPEAPALEDDPQFAKRWHAVDSLSPSVKDPLDGTASEFDPGEFPGLPEDPVEENRPAAQVPVQIAPPVQPPETIEEQLSRVSSEVRSLEALLADKKEHQSWLLSRMAEQGPPNTAQDHAEQARRISQAITADGFGRERKSATRRRFMGQQK